MSQIEVTYTNVPTLLKKLKSGEWLTPEFQREFVWNNAAVIGLVNSIIDAKPIGMVTLWEQEDKSDLELEHISIPDYDPEIGATGVRHYGNNSERPGRYYAILDGKQRSTAIALAFGGLRAGSGLFRTAGKYFLNVAADDPLDRIVFHTEKEITKNGLNTLTTSIGKGLFPLASDDPDQIYSEWMKYNKLIASEECYPKDNMPPPEEIARRDRVLQAAFNGIINTKLAVYIVPKTQSLGEICEIFETLNTTGTKVSTVDLIHSWLYADTIKQGSEPVLLRAQIDELGDEEGAAGWASSKNRPELIAQFAAAIHVALDNKPEPRSVSGAKVTKITSIKAPDLLAVPDKLWRRIFDEKPTFASFLGDMQDVVAGGRFTLAQCPYPASAAIYLALRWYRTFDAPKGISWTRQHLDALFKAFFWRNTFATRYDQGFLTKAGRDLNDFKEFLELTDPNISFHDWRIAANSFLDHMIPRDGLSTVIKDAVSDGTRQGALKKAATMLLYARARFDTVDPSIDISNISGSPELHHIFPKDWCVNHRSGIAKNYLRSEYSGQDWVNSAANLMPMARSSNRRWKSKSPATAIAELGIKSTQQHGILQSYFVDRKCLEFLEKGENGVASFFEHRASLLADEYESLLRV